MNRACPSTCSKRGLPAAPDRLFRKRKSGPVSGVQRVTPGAACPSNCVAPPLPCRRLPPRAVLRNDHVPKMSGLCPSVKIGRGLGHGLRKFRRAGGRIVAAVRGNPALIGGRPVPPPIRPAPKQKGPDSARPPAIPGCGAFSGRRSRPWRVRRSSASSRRDGGATRAATAWRPARRCWRRSRISASGVLFSWSRPHSNDCLWRSGGVASR